LTETVFWATKKGFIDFIKYILTERNLDQETRGVALEMAAEEGHLEICKALLASGIINGESINCAFEAAHQNGQSEIGDLLEQLIT
jgi:ankyrin repeat protein